MDRLHIEVVQLNRNGYFWVLATNEEHLAHSRKIEPREVIMAEAEAVAAVLDLPVLINERG